MKKTQNYKYTLMLLGFGLLSSCKATYQTTFQGVYDDQKIVVVDPNDHEERMIDLSKGSAKHKEKNAQLVKDLNWLEQGDEIIFEQYSPFSKDPYEGRRVYTLDDYMFLHDKVLMQIRRDRQEIEEAKTK